MKVGELKQFLKNRDNDVVVDIFCLNDGRHYQIVSMHILTVLNKPKPTHTIVLTAQRYLSSDEEKSGQNKH